ncbi:hypothetical protein AMATHDRAFT_66542 [Amanita thiersii Skay4041]|uniref:Transmembrane protein n=1 Tax=Amanita thiersii Skay4041 TaxID=703135 RepID=A0A2A9NJR7_9AGAR|nr:hypothetical protein AMATHDRAFT_66542 [Amanita thiersii Skay4041]
MEEGVMNLRRSSRPFRIPFILFCGLMVLLIGGWAFFVYTSIRPVPLPDYLAIKARDNPLTKAMIVTLIATALSMFSSFLLTQAICYALTIYLTRRELTLFGFSAGVVVANKGFILNRKHLRWTFFTLFLLVVLGAQTAGWTTLLTPTDILVPYPIAGVELDMTSVTYLSQFQASVTGEWSLDPSKQPDTQISAMPSVIMSGDQSTRARFQLPSTLSFNNFSYIGSTGGILPANLNPITNVVPFSAFLPINTRLLKPLTHHPQGFQKSYNVTQQGFTANVTCQQRQLDAQTVPALQVQQNTTVQVSSFVITNVIFGCNGTTTTLSITNKGEPNFVLAFVCPPTAFASEYDVVFIGRGRLYNFLGTSVCTVDPKVVTVNVNYQGSTSSPSFPNTITVSDPLNEKPAPEVGLATLAMLVRETFVAQTETFNFVGNVLSSFYYSRENERNIVNDILESFIKGTLEFGATLLRTSYTRRSTIDSQLGTDPLTQQDLKRTTGTYHVQTIGWSPTFDTAQHVVLLAPSVIIFIALFMLTSMCVSRVRSDGEFVTDTNHMPHIFDPQLPEKTDHLLSPSSPSSDPQEPASYSLARSFNPTDVLHILESTTLRPNFEGNMERYGEDVVVRLEENGKLSFSHSSRVSNRASVASKHRSSVLSSESMRKVSNE